MPLSRRDFLKWPIVMWVLARWFPARAATSPAQQAPAATLGAWLDTLIPADETPSATQLGVDRMMLAAAANDPDYRIVLDFGRKWLDAQAQARGAADFAALDTAAREAVAARAAGAGEAPEYYFYISTREEAFKFYYSQPESWPGMGYRGPPQPLGHMNYTREPGHGIDG